MFVGFSHKTEFSFYFDYLENVASGIHVRTKHLVSRSSFFLGK